MKTNYFTKVEDRYVFNVSLIFWHLLIALATLAIIASILIFLWGIVPASLKKVEKQPYPEKEVYPAPIKVSISELNLDRTETKDLPEIDESMIKEKEQKQLPTEDLTGKGEFEAIIDTLNVLIPPTKYSWKGKGYYTYPQGKTSWDIYKREIYRRWVVTESGITAKLNRSYQKTNAKKYTEKKKLVEGYIMILKLLPENKRLNALEQMINNVANNIQRNNAILNALSNVISKIDNTEVKNINIISLLTNFGVNNPNEGIPFINYVSTIIGEFDKTQQYKSVINLIYGFNRRYLFNQNIDLQKEATNLYIPLIPQLKIDQQSGALIQYYNVFLDKNNKRNDQIKQIESNYEQAIAEIESKFVADQKSALRVYESKKAKKEKLRLRALTGIGGGIVLIVLIATFLAFLSIQRSVRKMEDKMNNSKDIN